MLQMTSHLTRWSRLWTFQLLEFEVFQVRLQKKATSIKGAIFVGLKIKNLKKSIKAHKRQIFFYFFY
jgi:hypothetical protein